jgi:hypothetical protein
VVKLNLQRVVRVLEGLGATFESHVETCGDRVLAIVLSEDDWTALSIVEIWGLPVLRSGDIEPGRVKLLCESKDRLIPPHETVEDLQEIWANGVRPTDQASAPL